jgi:hypothetical protein
MTNRVEPNTALVRANHGLPSDGPSPAGERAQRGLKLAGRAITSSVSETRNPAHRYDPASSIRPMKKWRRDEAADARDVLHHHRSH